MTENNNRTSACVLEEMERETLGRLKQLEAVFRQRCRCLLFRWIGYSVSPCPLPRAAAWPLPRTVASLTPAASLRALLSLSFECKQQETGHVWHLLSGVRRPDMPACQKRSFLPPSLAPFRPPVLKDLGLTDKCLIMYSVGQGTKEKQAEDSKCKT